MPRYHISRQGKPAVCKAASDETCPLGGRHFASKDAAVFYTEAAAAAQPTPAFPQADETWRRDQMLAYWRDDQEYGFDRNPYVREGATPEEALEERALDYESGFMTALRHPLYNRAEVYARAAADLGADPIDRRAWSQGYRRAESLRTAKVSDFLTDLIDDPRPGENAYAGHRFLENPFTRGQEIDIPAGSVRVADGANEPGILRTSRLAPGRYRVLTATAPYADTGSGQLHIRPAIVLLEGKSKRYQVAVTPAILTANGHPLIEVEPAGAYLVHPEAHNDTDF